MQHKSQQNMVKSQSIIQQKLKNKYASYPDWCISTHADHRHRPVCHTWQTTDQHIIDFSFWPWGLTAGPMFTKRGDNLLPTQVYHPPKFCHPWWRPAAGASPLSCRISARSRKRSTRCVTKIFHFFGVGANPWANVQLIQSKSHFGTYFLR